MKEDRGREIGWIGWIGRERLAKGGGKRRGRKRSEIEGELRKGEKEEGSGREDITFSYNGRKR